MIRCEDCLKVFTSKRTLYQHVRQKHNKDPTLHLRKFVCGHCGQTLASSFSLLRHISAVHKHHKHSGNFKCISCFHVFGCRDSLESHVQQTHLQSPRTSLFQRTLFSETLNASSVQSSIHGSFTVFRFTMDHGNVEPFQFLTSNEYKIITFFNDKLPYHGSSRIGIAVHIKLCKPLEDEQITVYFHSPMERLAHEITEEEYTNMIDALISQLNVYCSGGSGWVTETLLILEIRMAGPYRESASSFIDTPSELKDVPRSLLNIKNQDEFCFLYCVLAGLFPQNKHADRPSTYSSYLDQLVFKSSDFPMPLSKIRFFEKQNNVSIAVYRFEGGRLINVFHSKNRSCRRKVKLLLLVDEQRSHYCLIKTFQHNAPFDAIIKETNKGPKSRFCGNCMQSITKHNFITHVEFCEEHKPLEIKMPEKDKRLIFNNWQKTQLNPFVVYADLEAIDVASDGGDASSSNTVEIERQYPASFGAVLVESNCKYLAKIENSNLVHCVHPFKLFSTYNCEVGVSS